MSRWDGSPSSNSKRIFDTRSAPVIVLARQDVHLVVADSVAVDVLQQARAVERLHLDERHEAAGRVVVPLDLDQPLGLRAPQRHGVGAVGAVHRHAAAPGDEAHDLVARHRRAAPGDAHHHVVEALDVDADLAARRAAAMAASRASA